MNPLTTRIIPFECKSSAGDDAEGWTFEGMASPYFNLDWCGDIVEPGAFDEDIALTRTEGKVRNEHGVTTGRLIDATATLSGLEIKGLILPTSAGKDQYILVKGRAITKLSIGYTVLRARYLEGEDQVLAYWESKGYTPSQDDLLIMGKCYCVRVIERCRVHEVSTTWLPMNDSAEITSVKSADAPARLTFADHSQRTLAAVEEFCARAEGIRALRTADGRELGTKARGDILQLKARLETLLVATEPPTDTNSEDKDQALFDEWLALETRLRSAGV
ncbi:MAG: HK97 family phage prohead protease [Isosphaeraceae bacterium]|nr:HK97 family phage prohead protease [Isosphaeraceae bacterium]